MFVDSLNPCGFWLQQLGCRCLNDDHRIQRRGCNVDNCKRTHSAFGFCSLHYSRWKNHGDPLWQKQEHLSFTNPDGIKNYLLSKRNITEKGCWEWPGKSLTIGGYGRRKVDAIEHPVHRISAAIFLGFDIWSDLFVCHKCDNPPCYNPDHLFIGTSQDNSSDMIKKGRQIKGEQVKISKLKTVEVQQIKNERKCGKSYKTLAKKYGVSPFAIYSISKGLSWRHVNLPEFPNVQ